MRQVSYYIWGARTLRLLILDTHILAIGCQPTCHARPTTFAPVQQPLGCTLISTISILVQQSFSSGVKTCLYFSLAASTTCHLFSLSLELVADRVRTVTALFHDELEDELWWPPAVLAIRSISFRMTARVLGTSTLPQSETSEVKPSPCYT